MYKLSLRSGDVPQELGSQVYSSGCPAYPGHQPEITKILIKTLYVA